MRNPLQISTALICLVLCLLIGASHDRVRRLLARDRFIAAENVLPSPESLKLCALGYDQLLADCYWLAFVQYVGDSEARGCDKYSAAERYLDLIVGLDPKFVQAYWFAAFVVGSDAKQPEVAARFIDRGIENNPNNWTLPFIAGINQYLYAHNDRAAAKYYRMAARFPEAPKWLSRQASILEARIPTIIKDINAWDSVYRSSSEPLVREKARLRLISLWSSVKAQATTDVIRKKAELALIELKTSR